MFTDLSQVCESKPFLGDVNVAQLVADHVADEHNLDLLQARSIKGALLWGQLFDHHALVKEQLRGGSFWVELDDSFGHLHTAFVECLLN